MSPAMVIARRAFGRMAGQSTTAFAVFAFLAASGAFFASGLFAAEGKTVAVAAIWAVAEVSALPLLASLVTMRLWSNDGGDERTELDLVVPVPERAFAIGRFAAAYAAIVITLVASLAVPLFVLPRCAPALAAGLTLARLLPAFVGLCVVALPLVAVGSLAGVFFRRSAPAAVTSFAVTCAVPYALYRALVAWSPFVRIRFAESPVDSFVSSAAEGYFSTGAVAVAVAVAFFAVLATSKIFALRRLAGGGRFVLKVSTVTAIGCAALAATLFSVLANQLDMALSWPGLTRAATFSARTREILSGISRKVHVTVCAHRDTPEFIAAARLVRALADEARSQAGAGMACEFVDPRWDPNAMASLAHHGGGDGMIVFDSGRRRIAVPIKDVDEGMCASAIQRLSMPAKSDTVLFTVGHGEPSVDDFGPTGMSDAVRALKQEGYRVGTLFSATSPIPAECSVLAVVGASTPFSAAEIRDVEAFLSQGGHLLVTLSSDGKNGLWRLMETCGISMEFAEGKVRTTDGSDIVVSMFGDHAVTTPLQGAAVVFAPDAVRFKAPSSSNGSGYAFTSLCESHGQVFAMAVEKGAVLKSDLAIRPARMVLIGDPSFLRNASLASRANANRDLFLNSVAWLACLDVSGSVGMADNVVSVRMDRRRRIRFVALSACCVPGGTAALALLVMFVKKRRRA